MEIDFIKSDINKIDKYVKLYQRCFSNYPSQKMKFTLNGCIKKSFRKFYWDRRS